MHKDNLRRIATYLLSGNLKADFSMTRFSDIKEMLAQTTCGSIGCAVGHTPFLGEGFQKDGNESWFDYAQRIFGISPHIALEEWNWCFDLAWASIDDTAEGAGRRILYMLNHGIPENFTPVWDEMSAGALELQEFIDLYEKEAV